MSFLDFSITESHTIHSLVQKIQELELRITNLENSHPTKEKSGHWTRSEHDQFITALMSFGFRCRAEIARSIPSRNSSHVSSHLQKFIRKISNSTQLFPLQTTFPLWILICGIARIRSEIDFPLLVDYDECAREEGEYVNNRVKWSETEKGIVTVVPLGCKLGKIGPGMFEIGAKQLEGVRNWTSKDGYQVRKLELQRVSSMKERVDFLIWYIQDKYCVEQDVVCGDFICGVVEQVLGGCQ